MNAIVPVNVAALRVSASDNNLFVSQFTGRTAVFNSLPWGNTSTASTGDTIYQPIQAAGSPAQPLDVGIHLHWQLPDYFLTGKQRAGEPVAFPPAPNRWLVVRSVSVWDTVHNSYGPVTVKAFVVESDFIGAAKWVDKSGMTHPSVPVPLPTTPGGEQPYRFMGRSLNYADWKPGSEAPGNFLPSYKGTNDQFLHLTALGFVGPGFPGYYPECTTVFGFWDHFMDLSTVGPLIKNSASVRFKASYQVVGWLDTATPDPLAGLGTQVTDAYNAYLKKCKEQDVSPTQTPADTLASILARDYGWSLPGLDPKATLDALPVPSGFLLNGIVQEVIWDQLANPGTTTFLATPAGMAVWQSTAQVAVGNTTTEALSARLSADLGTPLPPNELGGYEHLLNALQTGLLQQLEAQPSKLIYLDEALHGKGFAAEFAGWEWVLDQPSSPSGEPPKAFRQTELPPDLASLLDALNAAQQSYDKGRVGLVTRRRQLFMDWFRYVVAADNTANPDPNVDFGKLTEFLQSGGDCELTAVQTAGTDTGVLLFQYDPDSGNVTSVKLAPGSGGNAAKVMTAYTALTTALAGYTGWTLQAHSAPKFYTPTDPVLLAEGPGLVPPRRNGTAPVLPVRLASQVLTQLTVTAGGAPFTVPAATVPGVPAVGVVPDAADVQALVAEAFLLVPMLAPSVGAAPAVPAGTVFVPALTAAQGGLSPLEGGPGDGLFKLIRTDDYKPAANPTQSVAGPPAVGFTWSNATGTGWVADAVGWQAQAVVKELAPTRLDPFLPVYFTWAVRWSPLQWGNGTDYTPDNLTRYFGLDADAVDYTYAVSGGVPPNFTSPNPINYSGSVALSTRAAYSLAAQIDAYLTQYPKDPAKDELMALRAAYVARNFVSQALDGFSLAQTLSKVIPQLRVENLSNAGARDGITPAIDDAATADANDDWYDESFNGAAPVFAGALCFGPLRAGFLEVLSLEVADVFGQRMKLTTGNNQITPVVASSLKPPPADTVNAGKAFLPPRLLMPVRLWFRFLAAAGLPVHTVSGVAPRARPETNTHAATSPIFGWVVPNHLDQSLFFYNANGRAVGSFVRQDATVQYRTRPGNLANSDNNLAIDLLGANPHLAAVMNFVHGQNGPFLTDLMLTIQNSDALIQPASSAQDLALAVLIGRPLALARCVLGFETSGGLLPVSQADQSPTDPFPSDVNNSRFNYETRQAASSAMVANVQLPVRLGDLPNVDDGLVCFLPEGDKGAYGKVFSPAAPQAGGHGVERPTADTTLLTLNGPTAVMTLLLDPRAEIHATTGLLPVASLEIDPDQYHAALANIAVTFFTAPVLGGAAGLVLPTPTEAGYAWSWIQAGTAPEPLAETAVTGNAVFGYSPQTLVEGWLDLVPAPPPPPPPARTVEVLS